MNSASPETAAALRGRITELEQQLRLSDEGVSRLAERCFALEQQVEAARAANPAKETHANSALLLPKLFYDCGYGLSEQDSLAAPAGVYEEKTHLVTVAFELPAASTMLRLDPGELPCCITDLTLSDERLLCRPSNGIPLQKGQILFLRTDPNLYLEGLAEFPAGMDLVISYHYYPLEELDGEPLFDAVLDSVKGLHTQQTEAQRENAALRAEIEALRQQIALLEASRDEYAASLKTMLSSTSWKLTAPLRSLTGLLHRGR